MNRCDECGSWEAECANPEPVSDCGCARCAVVARDRARYACTAYYHDLARIGSLCEQTADEYPLKAVERTVQQFASVIKQRDELLKLAYIGEHRHSDLTWKSRCDELVNDLRAAQAELERMRMRPAEAEYARLDVMWQQLVRERDEYRAKLDAELPAAWREDLASLNQINERLCKERDEARAALQSMLAATGHLACVCYGSTEHGCMPECKAARAALGTEKP